MIVSQRLQVKAACCSHYIPPKTFFMARGTSTSNHQCVRLDDHVFNSTQARTAPLAPLARSAVLLPFDAHHTNKGAVVAHNCRVTGNGSWKDFWNQGWVEFFVSVLHTPSSCSSSSSSSNAILMPNLDNLLLITEPYLLSNLLQMLAYSLKTAHPRLTKFNCPSLTAIRATQSMFYTKCLATI